MSGKLRSATDLENRVLELGFLPFFKNSVRGFSVQEMTAPELWFSADDEGPWEWKGPVIRGLNCAYGKFFNGKAGYISLEWFPDFANWRRSVRPLDPSAAGDDFGISETLILDTVREHESLVSKELKDLCGLTTRPGRRTAFDLIDTLEPLPLPKGKRHSGLEPAITRLQMSTRIVIADFEYSISKSGTPYGWGLARYTTPEALYGADFLSAASSCGILRTPEESRARILERLAAIIPSATPAQLSRLID